MFVTAGASPRPTGYVRTARFARISFDIVGTEASTFALQMDCPPQTVFTYKICLLMQILIICPFSQRGEKEPKGSFPSRERLGALPLTIPTALCERFIYRLRRVVSARDAFVCAKRLGKTARFVRSRGVVNKPPSGREVARQACVRRRDGRSLRKD